jgi:hypothetical protein
MSTTSVRFRRDRCDLWLWLPGVGDAHPGGNDVHRGMAGGE